MRTVFALCEYERQINELKAAKKTLTSIEGREKR